MKKKTSDPVRLHIRMMVESEMEELRAEIKTAYAAASAACGKILHANQSLETSFQTKIINMLEKFDRSHRENVHETVQLAVQKGREQTEERLTQLDQYPEVFIAQSLASDNDQDRFQRQDNSNWEVENVEFKKSIRSRRPRLTPTRGWPLREICWMQRLAWRHSPRRDPAPAIKANAKKIGNRQDTVRSRPAPSLREICWMQRLAGLCSPRRDPGLIFRIGPGPGYLGGHVFGV